jgi:hypothetical protein
MRVLIAAVVALSWFSSQAWAGPVGSEFRVNSFRTSIQFHSSVARLSDGSFVVTWTSYTQDGSDDGVYGQRYDGAGNRVGSEFPVNTHTRSNQFDPSVAGLSDGGFIVTWTSDGQDRYGYGVYGQRYDSASRPVGQEFRVNTRTGRNESNRSVAGLSDGGFVVTWTSYGDPSTDDVHGQRYGTAGNRVGDEFLVNTHKRANQQNPSVAGLSDGGFVVAWMSYPQDGSGWGVYGQRYDSAGTRVGGKFQVNTFTKFDQAYPRVSALTGGGFVVTWMSNGQDGSSWGVYGQRYGGAGNRVGDEFQINTYTGGSQSNPFAAGLDDGGFVVTWQSRFYDGRKAGVYGQRYDSAGNRIGDEFQVNTRKGGEWPSVSGLSDGGFIVTWSSFGDHSSLGIFGQRYAP